MSSGFGADVWGSRVQGGMEEGLVEGKTYRFLDALPAPRLIGTHSVQFTEL